MAKITLIEGDYNINLHKDTEHVLIENNAFVSFAVNNTDDTRVRVIDTSRLYDYDLFCRIIKESIHDTIIIFSDRPIPAGLTKSALKPKYNTIMVGMPDIAVNKKPDVMTLMNMVLNEKNREKVYTALQANKGTHFILFKYLVCNVDLYPQNTSVLMAIDKLAYLKNTDMLCSMLAYSFEPANVYRTYFPYKYPKKGGKTND